MWQRVGINEEENRPRDSDFYKHVYDRIFLEEPCAQGVAFDSREMRGRKERHGDDSGRRNDKQISRDVAMSIYNTLSINVTQHLHPIFDVIFSRENFQKRRGNRRG
ncbi:hypothetical protein WN48_00366 [Eufriesea mexicana]|nr:hypothetical protein WN48_00366 [Eufriesea mexicana]